MSSIDPIDVAPPVLPRLPGRGDRGRIGLGLICSLALHGLAALLIFLGLPDLMQALPKPQQIIPVDLVQLGDRTASPPAPQTAEVPQQKAPETSRVESPNPVPMPQVPPPTLQAKPPKAKEGPLSDPLGLLTLQDKPELPRAKQGPTSHPPAKVKPPKPAPPLDDLQAKLQSLARQQQQQAMTPARPRQQDDPGASNLSANNGSAVPGLQATYSAKDFIRAQIERHWYLDKSVAGGADFIVSVHLVLKRDGSIETAEIVNDQGHAGDSAYRSVAISLRNAVRMSSPFDLPPGRFADVEDTILDFSARDASR